MSLITIDTAALATIVQELATQGSPGLGKIYLNGRAEGISSLHRQLLAPSSQSPAGQTFLDGRTSRAVESLQEALGHKDRFGGTLAPLFKLASVGNSDTWKNDAAATARSAPGPTLAQVVEVLEGALVEDVLPYHSPEWVERAQAVIAAHKTNRGGEIGQRQRETRMDTGSDRGGEVVQRQPQAYEIATGRSMLHDIGTAMTAAAVDATAEGYPDANKPANGDSLRQDIEDSNRILFDRVQELKAVADSGPGASTSADKGGDA